MGQRKNKKKRKKSTPAAQAAAKTVYPFSPRVSVIVAVIVCLYWILALLFTQAHPPMPVLLVGLGLIVFGTLFCMLFSVGRFELDANGVTIIRPLRRQRFKWCDLDELEQAEGYHPPADHYVPSRTKVPYVESGRTAFTFTNWVRNYARLRDDIKEHLHQAARGRHRH